MSRNRAWVLGIALIAGCLGNQALAACEAPPLDSPASWLPVTPTPDYPLPPPHPASDCPFYQAAWQTFLEAAQPDAAGQPAFLGYPRIEDIFEGGPKPAAEGLDLTSGIRQAGIGGILIDRNGSPVFYSMHFNDRFADFVAKHGLSTREGVLAADETLSFDEPGIVELKSAWRILDAEDDRSAYFWKEAWIPRLTVVDGEIVPDPAGGKRLATVGLVALHVVFTMEGHPEFVWSTFEHVGRDKQPDNAPTALRNPEETAEDFIPEPGRSYPFYAAGADATNCNLSGMPYPIQLAAAFDEEAQTFTAKGTLSTPVYREFPASKLMTTEVDEALTELNDSVFAAFRQVDPAGADPRQHYIQVGATWLDRPDRDFAVGREFANAPGEDSDTGPVAGEDALSSIVMESFTQQTFPNCFSCHDTREVYSSAGGKLMERKNINVSHAFSHFVGGGH